MQQGGSVSLDKQHGVCLLGIGKRWMNAVSNLVHAKLGRNSKAACGSTQLCASFEARIEGVNHAAAQKVQTDSSFCFNNWEVKDATWLTKAKEGAIPPGKSLSQLMVHSLKKKKTPPTLWSSPSWMPTTASRI